MPSETAKMMSFSVLLAVPAGGKFSEPVMPAEKTAQESSFSSFLVPEVDDACHWNCAAIFWVLMIGQ